MLKFSGNPPPLAVSSYNFYVLLKYSFITANKGQSANLLKTSSKRKRTKKQIEDEKQAAILKETQTAAKLSQYDILL